MALTNLESILQNAGSSFREVEFSQGPTRGRDIRTFPAEQQFPVMANRLGQSGTPARWVEDRNKYAQQYKGSTYIAIGAIARMAAMQKAKVFRKFKQKGTWKTEEVSPTHPLVELLRDVNPVDTEWDLWFYMVGWRLLTGDSFLYKARNGFGIPREIWPMPTQWVKVLSGETEMVGGYQIDSGAVGENFVVPPEWMIHIKNPSLDWSDSGRYYGTPSIKAAATTIDLEDEMHRRLYYQFKNFAAPGMVFECTNRLQPHQVHQLWANLFAQHSMADQTGAPMISHSGLKLSGQYNSGSVKELDYSSSLDRTLSITLATHGVPKSVVGLGEGMTSASMEGSLTQFCKMTVDPILEHISQHLTQKLASDFPGNLFIKLGPCNVDSQQSLRDNILTCLKCGAITPDEVRELLMNLKPFGGELGDRPVMISGFQVIDPNTGIPIEPGQDPAGKTPEKPDQNGSAQPQAKPVQVGRMALNNAN